MGVSRGQMQLFTHNALPTVFDKVATVGIKEVRPVRPVQGPMRQTRRYGTIEAGLGAAPSAPLVVVGAVVAVLRGRAATTQRGSRPRPGQSWYKSEWPCSSSRPTLPLAWDRYYLSIQPGSALAGGVGSCDDRRSSLSPLHQRHFSQPCRGRKLVVGILRRPETWVFVILLGSYAFFWHARLEQRSADSC